MLDNGNGTAPENRPDAGRPDGRWPRGVSGNPGGRPRALREVLDLARQHTVRAIERLAELMDSEDEGIALRACEALIDRGWGKPQDVELVDRLAAAEDRIARVREGA